MTLFLQRHTENDISLAPRCLNLFKASGSFEYYGTGIAQCAARKTRYALYPTHLFVILPIISPLDLQIQTISTHVLNVPATETYNHFNQLGGDDALLQFFHIERVSKATC